METTNGTPGARDARASLERARQAENTVRGIDTPWWYFVVSAALFAGLVLTQLLGERPYVWMALVAMVIVALNLLAARRAGVMGGTSRNVGYIVCVGLVLATIVGSLIWYETSGEAWTVVLMAAVAAVLMLIGGWLYRRHPS